MGPIPTLDAGARSGPRLLGLGLLLCSLGVSAATATAHVGATIIRPVQVNVDAREDAAMPLVTSVTTTTEGAVVHFN